MNAAERSQLATQLKDLQAVPLLKVNRHRDNESFEVYYGQARVALLEGRRDLVLIRDDGTRAQAKVGMIADWLSRLLESRDFGGFQEYSAEYLGSRLDQFADALDADLIDLIVSVLVLAWHNLAFRPATRRNVARSLVAYAKRYPRYRNEVIALMLEEIVAVGGQVERGEVEDADPRVKELDDLGRRLVQLLIDDKGIDAALRRLVFDTLKAVTRDGLPLIQALLDLHLPNAAATVLPFLDEVYTDWTRSGRCPSPIVEALYRAFAHGDTKTRQRIQRDLIDKLQPQPGLVDTRLIDLQICFYEAIDQIEIKRSLVKLLMAEIGNADLSDDVRVRAMFHYAKIDVRPLGDAANEFDRTRVLSQQLRVLLDASGGGQRSLARHEIQNLATVAARIPPASIVDQLLDRALLVSPLEEKDEVVWRFADVLETGPDALKVEVLEALLEISLGDLPYHSVSGKPSPPAVFRVAMLAKALLDHPDGAIAQAAVKVASRFYRQHAPLRNFLIYEARYNKDHDVVQEVMDRIECILGAIPEDVRQSIFSRQFMRGPGRLMSHVLTYQQDATTIADLRTGTRGALLKLATHENTQVRSTAESALAEMELAELRSRRGERSTSNHQAFSGLPTGGTEEPEEPPPNDVLTSLLRNWRQQPATHTAAREFLDDLDESFDELAETARWGVISALSEQALVIEPSQGVEVTLSVIEYLGRFAADEAVPAAARQQAIASLTHVLRWHPLREARHGAVGAIIAVLGLRATAGSTGTSGATQPPAGSPRVVCRVNSLDNRVAAELIDSAAAILVDPDLDDDEGFKAEVLRMLGLLVDVGKLPQSRVGRTVDAVNRVLQDSPFSDLQIAALGVLDSLLSPHQTAIAAPQKPAIQTRLIDVVVSGAALDLKSGALQLLLRYGVDVKLRSRVVNEFPHVASRGEDALNKPIQELYRIIRYSPRRERAKHVMESLFGTFLGTLLGYLVSFAAG